MAVVLSGVTLGHKRLKLDPPMRKTHGKAGVFMQRDSRWRATMQKTPRLFTDPR
jgi:hypothetical protein